MKTRLVIALAVGLALAIAGVAKTHNGSKSHHGSKGPSARGERGTFDYYVMALSWSPTFCELHPDEEEQCAHKGYGFVLHGLWPQYENGGGPENCKTTDEPDRKTVDRALAFMPTRSLVDHEWRAHGACTGLGPDGPDGYFGLADRAFAAVKIPAELAAPKQPVKTTSDALHAAFARANPGLKDDMLTLHCSRGQLFEVRVCLDRDLAPRSCGKRLQSRCPASATFELPASR
jgi:ribonuclease T2